MMPLILAFVFAPFPVVLNNPDGRPGRDPVADPLRSTPMLMFLRISAVTPPAWQIALSIVLLIAAIALMNWAAARIYRVGILMYGKKPTLPEILRWVKTR